MQLRRYLRVATPTLIIASLLVSIIVPLVFNSRATTANGEGDETTYYLLSDHLGSIDVVLDEDGNVVERRDYLPYGAERLSESEPDGTETDYQFTGKELDDQTGLNYYGARYYDSELGRFVSVDPWKGDLANPQTLNKYSYTLNNPLKYTDPTGAYQDEVHFDLTLFLAKSAGFSDDRALDIAYYNQLTDINKNTSPYNLDNGWMHFVDRNVGEMWAETAIDEKHNLRQFGTTIHFLQDTFSHSGHGYDWFKGGHIGDSILAKFGLAKDTDKTYEYSDDAMEMAQVTFGYLRKYIQEVDGTDLSTEDFDKQTEEIWANIETTIQSFVNANDEQQEDFFNLSDAERDSKSYVTE